MILKSRPRFSSEDFRAAEILFVSSDGFRSVIRLRSLSFFKVVCIGFIVLLFCNHALARIDHCSLRQLQAARDKATQFYKNKKVVQAIQTLSPLYESAPDNSKCTEEQNGEIDESHIFLWLASDYALYLFKDKQYEKCVDSISSIIGQPYGDEEEKAQSAVRHNYALCMKARVEQLGALQPRKNCRLKIVGKAIAVPWEILRKDVTDACLVLEFAKDYPDDAPDFDRCPHVALVEKKKNQKQEQRTLLTDSSNNDDSPISDVGRCCKITELDFRKSSGRHRLYVNGSGGYCGAGTEVSEFHATYDFEDTTLKLNKFFEAILN